MKTLRGTIATINTPQICGLFVVNNLHPKPKKKQFSIATRKIVDHLEVLFYYLTK